MKMWLAVFLWMASAVCCVAYDCPSQCKCGETIWCNVHDLTILKKILPTNITRLDLSSAGIKKIPPGTFENFTSLRYLSLANNSITFLSSHSFRGLHNLQELLIALNSKFRLRLRRRRKAPREECVDRSYPICSEVMDIRHDPMKHSPFPKHACVMASCENKQKKQKVVCLASKTLANSTCWPGMIGDNTGVKLALWTFGLLAVTSNLLVLVTLICNSKVRRSPICILIMNLLLGNVLLGAHIVILTVSDTVTYGDLSECYQERWEATLCVPLFIMKYIGLIVVVLSLALLTIERFLVVILKLPRLIDTCRAMGYVFESWIFAAIATVILWTKAGNWGYLCSTFSSSKQFADVSKGINLSLVGICIMMICLHIFIKCRTKLQDHTMPDTVDNRNATRIFLLALSTFLSWAVPYTLFLFTVPEIFTETIATQTMAISLSLNACLHTFLYTFDNDHLENLYSALSCRREDQKEETYKTEKSEGLDNDVEMGRFTAEKPLDPLSLRNGAVKVSQTSNTSVKVPTSVELNQGSMDTERRGSQLSKSEGAVIITNTSPTNCSLGEATVLLQSTPSSPTTSTRCTRAPDEGISECGTISSDTNVTWLSTECPSVSPSSPNALLKLNDGNSTLSSEVSSITPSKSPSNAGSLQRTKRRSNVIEKDGKRQRLRPLSPVRFRDKKEQDSLREKRNGVLVFRAGSDGLEIHEDPTSPTLSRPSTCADHSAPKLPCKTTDWERLATFLVIKPVSPRSKIKISDKDKKKGRQSLPETVIKGPERVRIFENPAINLESDETNAPSQRSRPTSPLSPTRHLAKLEEGDKLAELPLGLKPRNRISTASTVSRVSKTSLEWDHSDSYEYGDDEVMPPPPPPPPQPIPDIPSTPEPSPGPERKVESADHVECVQVKLDPANRYSLEWDPTGVQMRLSVISQDSSADGSKSSSSPRQKVAPEYV
ncbi:PREDICTED: uncharacterized protein LOC107349438 [Acropora digitifera]|uniref:uncharacterized protein LOC107349438 n=1 Tax=Acropora digitifera TaxID=70779 RepID=UPI00077B1CFB|nr:PREDICTED: uncharacterized protein LOC107349438 [Acropora digitifera]